MKYGPNSLILKRLLRIDIVQFQFSLIIYLYSRYQIQEVLIINDSGESTNKIIIFDMLYTSLSVNLLYRVFYILF